MSALLAAVLALQALAAAREGILSEELKAQGRYQEALLHVENGLSLLTTDAVQVAPAVHHAAVSAGIAPDVYECDRTQFASGDELESCLLINAAGLYVRQLQLESARPYYERALQKTATLTAEIRANLAWLEVLRGNPGEASRILEPPSASDSARVHLVNGVVHRETGRLTAAFEALRKAVALYQESRDVRGQARALAHLGTLHLGEARVEEARTCYERALELAEESGDVEAKWHALRGLSKTTEL